MRAGLGNLTGSTMIYNPRTFVHYPPKVNEILDGEFSTLPHPGQSPYLVATGVMLIRELTDANAETFMRLMLDPDRFPEEESVIIMKLLATSGKLDLMEHVASYGTWVTQYKGRVF